MNVTEPAETRPRRLARVALLVLVAALPFELEAPVARLGPLQLSSVELFLYVALGAWVVARAWSSWRAAPGARLAWVLPSKVHRALAGLAVVMIVSAAMASTGRPAAIKFTLRSLGGLALFWASADLLAAPGAVARAAAALAAGAVVAALLMVAELQLPGAMAALRPFHPQTFQTFGLLRSSGPFQYPNIAAMYLEAALPLVLVVGVGGPRRRPIHVALTALAGVVVVYALLLASSRAGIATALLVLLVLAVGAGRRTPLRRASAITLVLGAGAMAMPFFATDPLAAMRLQVWQSRPWYRSVIAALPGTDASPWPHRLSPGAVTWVGMFVRNEGVIVWPRQGNHIVYVSYHWNDATTGDMVVFEGERTKMPREVPPGESVALWAKLRAPERPGRYVVRWDLVQEDVTWFSASGDAGANQRVEVTPEARGLGLRDARGRRVGEGWPEAADAFAGDAGDAAIRMAVPDSSAAGGGIPRQQLWTAALRAWRRHPLLGLGPDNFRHVFGSYLGLSDADDRLHANNFYLEVLATLGAAGILAFGAVGVTLARVARRALRGPAGNTLALAVSVSIGAYLVHGLLDYFLEFTPTYALLWLLAGMLAALVPETHAARDATAERTTTERTTAERTTAERATAERATARGPETPSPAPSAATGGLAS